MGSLPLLHLVTTWTLAVAAWFVVARRRSHLPFAAFATWMPVMDLARKPLGALRHGHEHPLTGVARVAFHLEQAIVFSWSLFFLALCLHYYARRASWVPLALWAVLSIGVVLAYPRGAIGFGPLVVKNVFFVVTAAAWCVIVYGALFNRAVRVELAHVMLAMYAAVDVVDMAVPLARLDMNNWWLLNASGSLCAAAMTVAHIVDLRRAAVPASAEEAA